MAPVTRKYEVTPDAVLPGAAPARAPCAGGSHTWLTEAADGGARPGGGPGRDGAAGDDLPLQPGPVADAQRRGDRGQGRNRGRQAVGRDRGAGQVAGRHGRGDRALGRCAGFPLQQLRLGGGDLRQLPAGQQDVVLGRRAAAAGLAVHLARRRRGAARAGHQRALPGIWGAAKSGPWGSASSQASGTAAPASRGTGSARPAARRPAARRSTAPSRRPGRCVASTAGLPSAVPPVDRPPTSVVTPDAAQTDHGA